MSAYDAFLVCGPRDWLDKLSAAGPTIAAFTAVGVGLWQGRIAKRTFEHDKELKAPALALSKGIQLSKDGLQQVVVALTNEGDSRAVVETLELQVDGIMLPYDAMTLSPPEYWKGVLAALSIDAPRIDTHGINVPFRIQARETKTFLTAPLAPGSDYRALALAMSTRLKLEGTYSSLWGDVWAFPTPKVAGQVRSRRKLRAAP